MGTRCVYLTKEVESLSKNLCTSLAKLIYVAIKELNKEFSCIEVSPLLACVEILLNGELTLPRSPYFNRYTRSLYTLLNYLKRLGRIEIIPITSHSPFYKQLEQITRRLASNFKDLGKRLEELEKELFEDKDYIEYIRREYDWYEKLKNSQILPSDEMLDVLEKLFGREIIERGSTLPYSKELKFICERVLEGWQKDKKLYPFIYDIQIPKKFKARIIAPGSVLEDSYRTVHIIILSLLYPKTIEEIRKETGYKRGTVMEIISMLSSYGIIFEYRERGSLKYDLRSQHAYEIA